MNRFQSIPKIGWAVDPIALELHMATLLCSESQWRMHNIKHFNVLFEPY